ncbi:MAG: division/cell wall cluster transcriptional repressor MraZ [Oscillospiraceae bacterium]|nr:division/cell wall cluster transcriptional repressor MraZ [Oscillospiraceae bacterium]
MSEALIGTYYHNIDVKGRMNFPTKLREILGESFFITKGLDNCLVVYSDTEWHILMEKVSALPMSKGRNISRFLFSGAAEVIPDKQGRVLIPHVLREYASLDKDVAVIGALNRVEIWDRTRWDEQSQAFVQESMESVMEELGI